MKRSMTPLVLLAALSGSWGVEAQVVPAGPAHLVKDIKAGTQGSGPFGMIAVGRSVVFQLAGDPRHGFGPGPLWKSDGTEDGTVLVKDNATRFHNLQTRVGDTVFFDATDAEHGIELWKTDGTEVGTILVKDIRPGPSYIWPPVHGTAIGGRLFFVAFDPDYGREPWISDGTYEGTQLVRDIAPGSASSAPYVVAGDEKVAYFAVGASPGYPPFINPLWTSDGTEDGTTLLKDVDVVTYGQASWTEFGLAGRTLFFVGDDGIHGHELWKSDGTAAGTVLVRDITPGGEPDAMYARFTDIGGTLFFFRFHFGQELWKSDGTESGTVLVKDLGPGMVKETIAAGRALFFVSVRGAGQIDLWRSDGTEAGTRIVKENDVDEGFELRRRLGAVGSIVLFSASDGASGYELWRSDGTDSGTFPVQEIAPGPDSSHPHGFVVDGSRLFFAATDIAHGDELWTGRAAIVTQQPRKAVLEISDQVRDLKLPEGSETSLLAKLDAAGKAIDRGTSNAGAGSLGAFMNAVNAQRGKKIPVAAADDLVEFAEEIVELIDEQ